MMVFEVNNPCGIWSLARVWHRVVSHTHTHTHIMMSLVYIIHVIGIMHRPINWVIPPLLFNFFYETTPIYELFFMKSHLLPELFFMWSHLLPELFYVDTPIHELFYVQRHSLLHFFYLRLACLQLFCMTSFFSHHKILSNSLVQISFFSCWPKPTQISP